MAFLVYLYVSIFSLSDFDFCTLTWDKVGNWTQEREVQHRWNFSSKKRNSRFLCTSSKFLQYFKYSSWTYFLWLWLREVVLRCDQTMLLKSIHMHNLNCLNFDYLCCCFMCWKSTRDIQISDSRTTRSGSCFAAIHLGEQIRNYPQENFLLFYKKQNVIDGSKSVKTLAWW